MTKPETKADIWQTMPPDLYWGATSWELEPPRRHFPARIQFRVKGKSYELRAWPLEDLGEDGRITYLWFCLTCDADFGPSVMPPLPGQKCRICGEILVEEIEP